MHGCMCVCTSVSACVLICMHVYVNWLEDLVSIRGCEDVTMSLYFWM